MNYYMQLYSIEAQYIHLSGECLFEKRLITYIQVADTGQTVIGAASVYVLETIPIEAQGIFGLMYVRKTSTNMSV